MTISLAVIRLSLEVNSFSPIPTGLADFQATEWLTGEAALRDFAGTPTEMGAVAAFAKQRPDWDVTVLRAGSAAPGGPMDDELFEDFCSDVLNGLRRRRWDAVYLSLHGALCTTRRTTPEADLMAAVRRTVGDAPIGASFDMHANLGQPTIELLDVAAGYRTLPHIDMHDTAARVLAMLADMVDGRTRPRIAIARPGRILHSFHMRTTDGPMREIEAIARAHEQYPVLDVSPFGGFPYADSPFTGAAVTAVADGDAEAAQRAADAVAAAIRERAPRFAVSLPGPEDGIRQALSHGDGTIAVLESADNTYSGGIADTPGLLRSLLASRPRVPSVFAFLHDPELVRRAQQGGPGASLRCSLGGRVTPVFGSPIETDATVLRLTDGVFTNDGPMYQGVRVQMGPTAVLDVDGIQVIVTHSRLPVNDTAYFRLHGIDLARIRLLCVKAKNHFRASFAPVCRAFIEIDTPGPAGIDLASLPYRHAPRADIV